MYQIRTYCNRYSGRNSIFVSGSDELWVNGVIKSFEDTISNWEKEVTWSQ